MPSAISSYWSRSTIFTRHFPYEFKNSAPACYGLYNSTICCTIDTTPPTAMHRLILPMPLILSLSIFFQILGKFNSVSFTYSVLTGKFRKGYTSMADFLRFRLSKNSWKDPALTFSTASQSPIFSCYISISNH